MGNRRWLVGSLLLAVAVSSGCAPEDLLGLNEEDDGGARSDAATAGTGGGGAGGALGGSGGGGAGGTDAKLDVQPDRQPDTMPDTTPAASAGPCPGDPTWACLNGRMMFLWACLRSECKGTPGSFENGCSTSEPATTCVGESGGPGGGIFVRRLASPAMPCRADNECARAACRPDRTCGLPIGADCKDNFECFHGRCTTDKVCGGVVPTGSPCARDLECRSGRCTSQLVCG